MEATLASELNIKTRSKAGLVSEDLGHTARPSHEEHSFPFPPVAESVSPFYTAGSEAAAAISSPDLTVRSFMTIGPRGSITSAKTLANVIPTFKQFSSASKTNCVTFQDSKDAILAQSYPTQNESTLLQKDTVPWLVLSEFGTRHKVMSFAAGQKTPNKRHQQECHNGL